MSLLGQLCNYVLHKMVKDLRTAWRHAQEYIYPYTLNNLNLCDAA